MRTSHKIPATHRHIDTSTTQNAHGMRMASGLSREGIDGGGGGQDIEAGQSGEGGSKSWREE